MHLIGRSVPVRTNLRRDVAAVLFAAAIWLCGGAAQASGKTYVMKISVPTLHDTVQQVADRWAAAVQKDSDGRIKAQVYPASQLGSIPRQIEGTQFGSIQAVPVPPEFMVGLDQRFGVFAAPGLIDSMQEGQRLAADPTVLNLMLGLVPIRDFRASGYSCRRRPRLSREHHFAISRTSRAREFEYSPRPSRASRSSALA